MTDLRVRLPEPCSERWGDMAQQGCNRFCAECEKTIYDLSSYTFDQAEKLIRSEKQLCVKAKLSDDGTILLKPSTSRQNGRLLAVAMSACLLATPMQVAAANKQKNGIIEGKVERLRRPTTAIAISPKGKKYKAKLDDDGNYTIKNVPPGSYQLKFQVRCSYRRDDYSFYGDPVVVKESAVVVANAIQSTYSDGEPSCPIYVGVIEVESGQG
jgi:hypothetical protein